MSSKNIQSSSGALGERIRMVRTNKGLTQEGLADKLGVTPATINRYEKGHRVPDAIFINQLVIEMDCEVRWLLTGQGEMFERESSASLDNESEKLKILLDGMSGTKRDIAEKILQVLNQMPEEKGREVLTYSEEKQLFEEMKQQLIKRKTG